MDIQQSNLDRQRDRHLDRQRDKEQEQEAQDGDAMNQLCDVCPFSRDGGNAFAPENVLPVCRTGFGTDCGCKPVTGIDIGFEIGFDMGIGWSIGWGTGWGTGWGIGWSIG